MTKTAFVFSGGGARGAFQVGLLRRVFEYGCRPDIVTGVSIGALNGFFAAQHKLEELESLWRSVSCTSEIYEKRWLSSALMYFGWQWGYPSLYTPGSFSKKIVKFVKSRSVKDFKATFHVSAVDLITGRYITVDHTNKFLDKFLLGSTAIPILFPPVRINKWTSKEYAGLYVDAGVCNSTPVDEAVMQGADVIHIFLTRRIDECEWEVTNHYDFRRVIGRIVNLNLNRMLRRDLLRIKQANNGYMTQIDGTTRSIDIHVHQPSMYGEHAEIYKEYSNNDMLNFQPASIDKMIKYGYDCCSPTQFKNKWS